MDGALDELSWPLLLLFYVMCTFPSSTLFYVQMEKEACISAWETGWGHPKGPSLPVSAYGCSVWEENTASCPWLCMSHASSSGPVCAHQQLSSERTRDLDASRKQLFLCGPGAKGLPSTKAACHKQCSLFGANIPCIDCHT